MGCYLEHMCMFISNAQSMCVLVVDEKMNVPTTWQTDILIQCTIALVPICCYYAFSKWCFGSRTTYAIHNCRTWSLTEIPWCIYFRRPTGKIFRQF